MPHHALTGGCFLSNHRPHRHGDMLYMEQRVPPSPAQGMAGTPGVMEDEVDQVLSKKDGKIHRPRDPHL